MNKYHLIVRDASQWQGFLMTRSINTLDSFRSYAWGLEARFLRVLPTGTRNIGRNRVSSVSVRSPPLAFLDRRSLKPLIFRWNILCLISVACFYRIAIKPLTNYQLSITSDIMSDRLTIISRSGRVFEMGDCWQVLFAHGPLQKSRSLDRT